MRPWSSFIVALTLLGALARPVAAERVKELARVAGVRSNHLTGFGIVVGLAGSGDDASSPVVRRSLAKLLTRLGVTVDAAELKAKNAAAVVVTAELPPFARPGAALDVTGGVDGVGKSSPGPAQRHAAQGARRADLGPRPGQPVAGGEFVEEAAAPPRRATTRPSARSPAAPWSKAPRADGDARRRPGIRCSTRPTSTATRRLRGRSRNRRAWRRLRRWRTGDAGTVVVTIGAPYRDRVAALIATIEQLEVIPDATARVVVDERSGVVVLGAHVVLHPAVVTFGALTVEIGEAPEAVQPGPLAAGDTTIVARTDIQVAEAGGEVRVVPSATTVADVAAALASLGAKPRDLVAVLRALRTARALRADLVTQ
ncbi:MAG: flagellar basal body P-ring protein FlgI [Kofleriaceae bacterium]